MKLRMRKINIKCLTCSDIQGNLSINFNAHDKISNKTHEWLGSCLINAVFKKK